MSSRVWWCAAVVAAVLAVSCPVRAQEAEARPLKFTEVPAEQSGLTDGIDETVKYAWMSTLVDVNGDTHLDLMYYGHHGGGAGFWFGKGDGTFTFDKSGFTARWVFGERDPTWWDFNGDGFMDGIQSPHVKSVLCVNDGTGHWKVTDLVLRGTLADLDGDGRHREIFNAGAVSAIEPSFDAWGKTVPAKLDVKPLWSVTQAVEWPKGIAEKDQYGRPNGGFRMVHSVDLDGDDRNEVVLIFSGGGFETEQVFTWVLERGADAKNPADWKDSTARRGLPTEIAHWLYPEDLDVDGDLDLVDLLSGEWYVNDGKGQFAKASSRLFDNKTRKSGNKYVDVDSEVFFVDVDDDGRRDLVTAADHTPAYATILNLGGGKFVESSAIRGNRRGRKLGDVDHDGDLDLVVTRKNQFVLLRNDTGNLGLHVKVAPKAPAEAALGCKLWVWRAGEMDKPASLLHYRQCFQGQERTRSNILDTDLHVGLGQVSRADVRVRFPSGVVREVKGVKAGTTVEIKE